MAAGDGDGLTPEQYVILFGEPPPPEETATPSSAAPPPRVRPEPHQDRFSLRVEPPPPTPPGTPPQPATGRPWWLRKRVLIPTAVVGALAAASVLTPNDDASEPPQALASAVKPNDTTAASPSGAHDATGLSRAVIDAPTSSALPSTTSQSPTTTAPMPTTIAEPTPGVVVIVSCNSNEEIVVLENQGGSAISLSGWRLHDDGDRHSVSLDGITLDPGEQHVWNNDGDRATLLNGYEVIASRPC